MRNRSLSNDYGKISPTESRFWPSLMEVKEWSALDRSDPFY